MVPMRHGGVTGRPGTMYVGTTHNAGAAVRLIPFIFNETGNGQSYVLEFGNLYVAFYQNGGVVVSGGVPYTIVSPYAQADLQNLQFAESADVITITHPSYPPYELKRLAATNWTLTIPTFAPQIATPTNVVVTGVAGAITLIYGVTAINSSTSEESLVKNGSTAALAEPTAGGPATITWLAVSGAGYYRVYRLKNGAYGYIGVATGTTFDDIGYTPDFTNSPPADLGVFASPNNYPSTVGFIQQRRAFANTNNNPIGFWLSQPGDFYNFTTRITPKDDDAIVASIAGEEVNAIQHIVELKFMLIMTTGAELSVQGNGSGVVTPSAINAAAQSSYGSSSLRPLKVGDICLFNQALGSFVRDLAFDFSIDGYRGNDITVFSSHLFEGYSLVDWCYQKIPDSIVWAARSDGTLLSLTYVREQQILAWAHHDFTNGTVENVCAIPENGTYALYLSIKRVINGATVRYIERMSSRLWTDPLNATYLDCFSSYNGINSGSTTMTLTSPGGLVNGVNYAPGQFASDGSAYKQLLTLTASVDYFGATAQVGNQIFLQDATYQSSNGMDGSCIRCTIQSIRNTRVATVTPSEAVPAAFQAVAMTTWARAVQAVSGLSYLAGQQVSVWADRFVVGSPLNNHLATVYTVSNTGTLTLDKPYSVIYVGLPMTQDTETLDLESYFGETMLSKRKRVGKIAGYFYKTRSFFAGSENPDTNLNNTDDDPLFQLYEEKIGEEQITYDEPPVLFTDQDYVIMTGRWNLNGRCFIRNVDPVPFSLLAISPFEEDPSQGPYKRV